MPRQSVEIDLFNPIGPYSHAIRHKGHLYLSGTPGVNPETGSIISSNPFEQALQALRNLVLMVEAAGGGESDFVSIQVHLINTEHFEMVNSAFEEVFSQPYPARTVLGVSSLPKPGALLTISGVAVL
ncbi:RidA family protein [Enterobacter hormaechei]|uniref:RidA family protein n=1 Tax=Enterobacter hormaechei TaxID=158836 RepID=UPI0037515771